MCFSARVTNLSDFKVKPAQAMLSKPRHRTHRIYFAAGLMCPLTGTEDVVPR
jgi:hypothetical protein